MPLAPFKSTQDLLSSPPPSPPLSPAHESFSQENDQPPLLPSFDEELSDDFQDPMDVSEWTVTKIDSAGKRLEKPYNAIRDRIWKPTQSPQTLEAEKPVASTSQPSRDVSEVLISGASMLGGLIQKTANLGKALTGWGLKKAVDVGAVRSGVKWFIGNHPYAQDLEEYKAQIRGMRGTGHLVDLIELLQPHLLENVLDKLEKNPSILGNFVLQERQYCSDMISALLFKGIKNLMGNAIKDLQEDNPDVEFNGVAVLFEFLLDSLFTEFDKIDKNDFQNIQDLPPERREQETLRLFQPAATALLHQVFPRGKDELVGLGSTAKWLFWSVVVDDMVPNLLAFVYKVINFSEHETERDKRILSKKGGVPIRAIARSSARLIREITPEGLAKGKNKLAKIICEIISDTPETNELQEWLADTIGELAASEHPTVERIWGIMEEEASSLLCHGLATVAYEEGEERPDRNIIPVIINKLLDLIVDFLEENHEAIDHDLERLKNDHNREVVDDHLLSHFVPLTEAILKMADLYDNPLVSLIKSTLIPTFFLDCYRDMLDYQNGEEKGIDGFRKRLKRKLFDDQDFLNRPINERNDHMRVIAEAVAQQEDIEEAVFEAAGITQHVNDIAEMFGDIADDVYFITERYVKNNTLTLVELIRKDLAPQHQRELAEGIQEVLNDPDNPKVAAVFDYGKTLINATIFKVLVAVAENTPMEPYPPEVGNRNGNMVANFIHRIFTMFGEHFPDIHEQIAHIKEMELTEEDAEIQITELFQPLSLELLNLAGENWQDLLPVPNDLKEPLEELLKEELIPSLLHLLYREMYGWIEEIEEMEEEIDETFGSDGSKHAISAFATYIQDYIPYFLEEHPEKVVKLLEHTGGKYFQHMSEAQKIQMHRMMVRNINIIGKDQANATVWKGCAIYSKAIILKMVKGIAKEISLNERVKGIRGESSFLLQTVVKGLGVAKDHFVSLSNIPEKGRISPAHTVKHSDILIGFKKEDILHPALDLDAAGSNEERTSRRMEYFYKPLARDFIALADIDDPLKFPIPQGIRGEMFELFKEDILPEVLMNIFNDMLEPRNINKSMLTLIDRLNSTIEELEDDHYIENDGHQRALNEACGEIIKSMVNLVPEIFTKTFFPADKIKEMTAEYVGGLVRRKLQKTNMLEIMDMILTSTTIPDPRQKEWRDYRAQMAEDRKIQKELIRKLTAYISKQVQETLRESIRKKWDAFQVNFDRAVEKFAGKPGLIVKKIFDFFFGFIFFKVLGPLFEFLFYKIFWFFVDLIIVRKSMEIINDSHMKIHENLIFNLTDSYISLMKLAKDQRSASEVEGEESLRDLREEDGLEDDDFSEVHTLSNDVIEGFMEPLDIGDSSTVVINKPI